jgi:hypothetical protein
MSFLNSAGLFNVIPDSVVSRTNDNSVNSDVAVKLGARIETSVEWPSIGARLSSNTSGASTAYIYRVSDGSLLGSTDISGLSAGESFTVEGVNLQPDDGTLSTTYNFVVDNNGSGYAGGYYNSPTYPYDSSDGDISIINSGQGVSSTNPNGIWTLVDIGGVGF